MYEDLIQEHSVVDRRDGMCLRVERRQLRRRTIHQRPKECLLGLLGFTKRTKAQIASVATGGCNQGMSASKDSNVGSHNATALIGERKLERDMRSDRDGQKVLSDSSLACASAKKTPSSIR